MEFDSELLFNFVPITATILAIIVAIITIVQRLKWRWRIKVNCWFCNINTKIYRQEIDWWQCPSCEQYNGFSKDGSYNYDIPEQRSESLNNSPKLYSSSIKNEFSIKNNGLCKTCNRNEELKLYELRSVDSSSWLESEVDIFKKNLEEKYPLCKKCNTFIKRILKKQSVWLMQYKMLAFKQKPMKIIINNSRKLESICRIFLTLLSAGIIYSSANQALPIVGAIVQLIAAKIVPIPKRNFELLLTLLWMAVSVLTPFNTSILIKVNLNLIWITLKYITGYQIIAVLASILGFTNITTKSSSSANANISFKKLDSPTANHHHSLPRIPNNIDQYDVDDESVLQSTRRSPVDITHLLTTPTPTFKSSSPAKSTIVSPNFRICDSQRSTVSTSSAFNNHQIDILESSPKHSPTQYTDSKKNSLNESLRTLSSLSLNETQQKQTLKNPKIFETKMYGTSSNSDLFRRNCKLTSGRKFILAPPKLKSVSQTSWVAGGYWQTGMDSPTLSRSSSQSSGFGSAGSIFGPSREPSIVNDVDRCSNLSDVTQCCHNLQRQQSINPINTIYQHQSSSSSTSSPLPVTCRGVIGSEFMATCMVSPSSNMMMNASPCGQSTQSSICHSYHINDQYSQNRNMNFNMIQRSTDVLPCINYPSTILTNPILLPVLLCGSLVFNMVVFCTILLR
ncbi:hypothetical protein PV325_000659 [Microctonus aethiopoides]|nr:hypothetical protein PV325_000659 [Microctonus aethiopoides]